MAAMNTKDSLYPLSYKYTTNKEPKKRWIKSEITSAKKIPYNIKLKIE